MEIPGVPPQLLQALARASEGRRLALVGGAVRDLLLHQVHRDPWRGLFDLDVVVEGCASHLAQRLPRVLAMQLTTEVPCRWREHGRFGTVELELVLPEELGGIWLLDIASARQERYPLPAENPQVCLGRLDDDLARRDFSVNSMALVFDAGGNGSPELVDPHGGQADLAGRQLRLLHADSLRDDPTRLVRAARYAARLDFKLAESSLQQARATLAVWPWSWRPGDDPSQAPPALGTRLRMELELLLEREPWTRALAALQSWGGLALLDASLQADHSWHRRLRWAQRLGLPRLAALVLGCADPLDLAERLQLPHRQQKLLTQVMELRRRLASAAAISATSPPSWWCTLLESPGLSPDAVALALAAGIGPRRQLLRWWGHWRYVQAPLSATQVMAAEGLQPGPLLGERLRQLRAERLDHLA